MPTIAEMIASLPEGGVKAAPDDEATRKTIAELHRLGPKAITEIIGLLVEANPAEDTRARYALHSLVTYAMQNDTLKARPGVAEALAGTLGGDRPKEVQAFVIRQLQLCGGAEVVPALGKLLVDPDLGEPACVALVAIREGAAEQLRAALPKAGPRMKLVLVQNLGVLRDAGALDALREASKGEDADLRLAALFALANAGSAADRDLLVEAAGKLEGYARAKATDACFLLAERLIAGGKKEAGAGIYDTLYKTRTDESDKHVRSAAEKALKSVGAT